jgi:quinol monooxygenase YgiN
VIHVIAYIKTRPGARDEVLRAVLDNTPAVRAEAGCLLYEASIDATDAPPFQAPVGPDTVVVIEQWEGREALLAHTRTEHMRAYGERTKPHVLERQIHILSPARS